jgi:hypothetical protein
LKSPTFVGIRLFHQNSKDDHYKALDDHKNFKKHMENHKEDHQNYLNLNCTQFDYTKKSILKNI